MKSTVVKRSIVLAGHKTSVSLEDPFWEGLKEIAKDQRKTLSDLVGSIDTNRERANLSSALRLFVLNHYQAQAASNPRDALSRTPPQLWGLLRPDGSCWFGLELPPISPFYSTSRLAGSALRLIRTSFLISFILAALFSRA